VAINELMETFLDMVKAGKCRVIPGTVGRRAVSGISAARASDGIPPESGVGAVGRRAETQPRHVVDAAGQPTGLRVSTERTSSAGPDAHPVPSATSPGVPAADDSPCPTPGVMGGPTGDTAASKTADAGGSESPNRTRGPCPENATAASVAADGAAWRPGWTRKKDRRAAAARGRVKAAQERASGRAHLPSGGLPPADAAAPTTARAEAIAAADLAGEPVETTARALGVSSRTVETYRAKPQHQGLMLELAERHRATLEDGYARAVISALADLEAGEWQARDRARAWLTEQVQRSDVARGLVAQAGGLAPALGGDKPTLTEVVMVLRQFQGPGAG